MYKVKKYKQINSSITSKYSIPFCLISEMIHPR